MALALAGAAFVSLRYFKFDVVWVLTGGLVLWAVLQAMRLA